MDARRRRIVKTCIDLAVVVVGLIVLGLFLNTTQTSISISHQEDNFKTKLDIAQQRIEQNDQEATENLTSYDSFTQAKLDSVIHFIDKHPGYAGVNEMAAQWGLIELYIYDQAGNATFSLGNSVDPKEEPFASLIENKNPVTIESLRYYSTKCENGGYAIAARDYAKEQAALRELTSAKHALSTIKVGANGFILAINQDDQTFAYLPQKSLIGQKTSLIGFDASNLTDGWEGWVNLEGKEYYGRTRAVNQYLFTAMVPKSEMTSANSTIIALGLIVFAAVLLLIVAYALILRRDEANNPLSAPEYIQLGKNLYYNKTMGAKMRNVAIVCLIAIFALTYYMQTLNALSRQSIISATKLDAVEVILDDNKDRITELTDEYAEEYTRRAQNVAWTIAQDPTLVNDEDLTEMAEAAQVAAIYVFDSKGRTVSTNTNYKDFVVSDDETAQSFPFWSVVKGYKDVYVQEVRPDDTPEANLMQYVGVRRLDDAGMVQLGMMPRRLKGRLASTEQDYVLHSIAVENGGYLFAVDKDDGTFITYPKTKYVGRPASDYGLAQSAMKDEFSGYQTIDGQQCFVTCAEYENCFLYTAVPLARIFDGRVQTAVIITLGGLVVILVLCAFLLLSRKMSEPAVEAPKAKADPVKDSPRRFFRVVSPSGKTRIVQSASSRWSGAVKWNELNPEQKLTRILSLMLSVAALAMVVWMAVGASENNSIFSYIFAAKWEKKPNIFSLTYILMIAIETFVVAGILRKLILYATGRFGARSETVGRLLDSFIKYVSVIGVIFYGLNFIGIDSATLMTSAGILALVVGLGAQKLIGDILAGMFIVFEGEFRVGDIVTVGDWCGTVLEIGIRTTKIQRGGDIKIISNSGISGVVNMTKQYSYASADIGIEYAESLERVETILNRELPLVKDRVPSIITGPFYNGVVSLGDSAVILRIVAQCQEKDRAQLGRDLNRELKLICDHNNISIPFPQIVINSPVEHEKATHAEKREAAAFVEEQKELSKDIPVQETR